MGDGDLKNLLSNSKRGWGGREGVFEKSIRKEISESYGLIYILTKALGEMYYGDIIKRKEIFPS
ncbi:MAG: hypothetical protein KDK54_15945 [Leptospiraceae bacterium]|nr:hypothetical protein [Leptospiraceae bacterium]